MSIAVKKLKIVLTAHHFFSQIVQFGFETVRQLLTAALSDSVTWLQSAFQRDLLINHRLHITSSS